MEKPNAEEAVRVMSVVIRSREKLRSIFFLEFSVNGHAQQRTVTSGQFLFLFFP